MKPRVYLIVLLLVIPVQASLFGPFTISGIRPDLPLALLYIIGLLAGPTEGALAGVGVGLLQDISSAGLIGLSGLTRGLIGLGAGVLGQRVLDIASPANIVFLAAFRLLEGITVSIFLQAIYGNVPFFSTLFARTLPQALYTGLLGTLMLRLIKDKNIASMLLRRSLQKE